jgi:hypothetical protein
MPPIGTLSVGVWMIRFREKWNMVKIDDPQHPTIGGIKKSSNNDQKIITFS